MKTTIATIISCMFALTVRADWPQYGGPDGRWVADAGDHQYLQDWSEARLVWTSETSEIGPGRGQAPRYGFRNADPNEIDPWGGAASPVISNGMLFQVYLRPVGEAYNKTVVEEIEKKHGSREGFSIEHLRRNFSIEAETVVVAIDLENGKTVWRQAFRGVQYNGDFAKPRGSNNSPAAGDGKVFVLGYDFVLRAHDAKTGKVLWQTEQPEEYAIIYGWIRCDSTTQPVSYHREPASFVFAFWDPATPEPYSTWTSASILLVPDADNPRQGHGGRLHGWRGCKRLYYEYGEIVLKAGDSITQNYLIQLAPATPCLI